MTLEFAYLALSGLMAIILIRIGFYAINHSTTNGLERTKHKIVLLSAMGLWHCYLYFVSNSGILADFSLPPKLPLLVIIPLFTFSGVFIYKQRHKKWIQSLPKSWLVFYQSFRIGIETILYFSVGAGILPALVTFEGYNYDIIFGISALIVWYLVFVNKSLNFTFVRYWNLTGLVIIGFIIFLFLTGTYFPSVYNQSTSLLTPKYTEYPYILVAGFLMPSAVFIHLLSLMQHQVIEK